MSLISEQVINLGAPGLAGALFFQVYIQPAYDQMAAAIDPLGVSVSPVPDYLGAPTSNYQLVGLPEPPPGGRATVVILSILTGEYLTAYSYSTPQTQLPIVSRTVVRVLANGPFTSSDTIGLIRAEVEGLGNPVDAYATFSLKNSIGDFVLQARPATISEISLLANGTYNFILSYALEVGHAVSVDSSLPVGHAAWFFGEFELNYGSGRVIRLPSSEPLRIAVRQALT